jgi:hypothetical protein
MIQTMHPFYSREETPPAASKLSSDFDPQALDARISGGSI